MKTLFTLLLVAAITGANCQPDTIDHTFGNAGFIKTNADHANFFLMSAKPLPCSRMVKL